MSKALAIISALIPLIAIAAYLASYIVLHPLTYDPYVGCFNRNFAPSETRYYLPILHLEEAVRPKGTFSWSTGVEPLP
jgi:hypothetical protein